MAGMCTVCGSPAEVDPSYNGYAYCLKHFRRLIVKRVRRDLRHQSFDPSRAYVFKDDGSVLATLTIGILRDIFGPHLDIDTDSGVTPGVGVILPTCLEDDVSARFRRFLEGSSVDLPGIRPLRTVGVEDVNALSGSSLGRSSVAHQLLLDLEMAQPGTFFSMQKVFRKEKEKKKKE